MKKTIFILSILLLTSLFKSSAQQIYLFISFNDTLLKPSKLVSYNNSVALLVLKSELNDVFHQLNSKSYLTSTTDSIIVDSNFYHVYIHLGKAYQWARLSNDNIDEEILSKIGFRDKVYNNKPFNQKQIQSFYNKIIGYYENNGYPFASIRLDSLQIEDNQIAAKLHIQKKSIVSNR